MKTLDQVTLDALDLHGSYDLPEFKPAPARKRLVVASGNALPTAKVVFSDEPTAVFRDEGHYAEELEKNPEIDAGAVLSASGKKHAPIVVRAMLDRDLDVTLITCDGQSPAAKLLPKENVFVTRSNPEPITYNTSTYMGMMLLKTREDAKEIKDHILNVVAPRIPPDLWERYQAFYFIVKPKFELQREMFLTKFDELFGGRLNGRCYTNEQTTHAKTVVPWDQELFISMGWENKLFGSQRLNIPMPPDPGLVMMLASTYYIIGRIQTQFPPWFLTHADEYKQFQEDLFRRIEAEGLGD